MSSLLKRMSRTAHAQLPCVKVNSTIPCSHSYRIGVVGAPKTGKTRMSILYTQGVYSSSYAYEETIEDVYTKDITMDMSTFYEHQGVEDTEGNAQQVNVHLEIIDTSGNEDNFAVEEQKWSSMHGFILMFDVTNRKSIADLSKYYNRILNERNAKPGQVPIVLACNKIDCEQPLWAIEEGNKLAREWYCKLIRTSSEANIAVEQCFEALIEEIILFRYLKPDDSILLQMFGDDESRGTEHGDHSASSKRKSISAAFKRLSSTFRRN